MLNKYHYLNNFPALSYIGQTIMHDIATTQEFLLVLSNSSYTSIKWGKSIVATVLIGRIMFCYFCPVYVQIFEARNFCGFRGFQQSAKIKLAKFQNTIYSKLLIPKNCFREMVGNTNPRKLCASKIWTYTVYNSLKLEGHFIVIAPLHSYCTSQKSRTNLITTTQQHKSIILIILILYILYLILYIIL